MGSFFMLLIFLPLSFSFTSPTWDLTECIGTLLKTFIIEIHQAIVKPISVILDEDNFVANHVLPILHDEFTWPIYVTDLNKTKEFRKRTRCSLNYVLAIKSVENLVGIVKGLKDGDEYWNHHVKLLIVVMSDENWRIMEKIADVIRWEDVNAVIITQDVIWVIKGTYCVLNGCQWNEWDTIVSNCPKNVRVVQNKVRKMYRALYMPNEPCNINVTNNSIGKYDYFIHNGVLYSILTVIADLVRIKLHLFKTKHTYGNVYSNGTCTGVFKEFENKNFDLLLACLAFSNDRTAKFYNTYPLLNLKFVWFVPHGLVSTNLKSLGQMVDPEILCLLVASLGLVGMAIRVTGVFLRHPFNAQTVAFTIYSAAIGAPVHIPRLNALRLLLSFVVVLNIFTNVAFLTALTSNLSNLKYAEKIDSELKIIKYNLQPYAYATLKNYFDNTVLKGRVEGCYNSKQCMKDVAYKKNTALAYATTNNNYIINNYTDNGYPLLHIIKDEIGTIPLSLYMRRGFHFYTHVNKYLFLLNDCGFLAKFFKDNDEKDLENSDIVPYAYETQLVFFENFPIKEKIKVCYDSKSCMKNVAYSKKVGFALSTLDENYVSSQYKSKNGDPLVYCIREYLLLCPITAYMRYGFPYYKKFSETTLKLFDGGFIMKFLNDVHKKEVKETEKTAKFIKLTETEKQSLKELMSIEDELNSNMEWSVYKQCFRNSYKDLTELEAFELKFRDENIITVAILNPSFNKQILNFESSLDVQMIQTFDSLNSFQQLVVKCSAVLKDHFPRNMLKFIVNSGSLRQIGLAIKTLFEKKVFCCAYGDFLMGNDMHFKGRLIDPNSVTSNKCECTGLIIEDSILFEGGIIGIHTVRRLQKRDKLIRTFENNIFSQCQCHLILISVYAELIDHCKGADNLEKLMESSLKYAKLSIEIRNLPEAKLHLDHAMELLVGMGKWKKALLAANWALKKAVSSSMSYVSLCKAYGNLITINSFIGKKSFSAALETYALRMIHFKRFIVLPEEVKATGQLYLAIFKGRMFRSELIKALSIGFVTSNLANSKYSNNVLMEFFPMFIIVIIFRKLLNEAVSVLQELEFYSTEQRDIRGKLKFYNCCLVMQLETCYTIVSMRRVEEFFKTEGFVINTEEPDSEVRISVVMWLW
ncbi:unnamed protein product [Brassicogethes aeneus]|uniref:Uncharacterized protein n=1 Tax=Brassicogethes aeneus TaxID=1431903 RepID=A0A9P0FHE2_BRAAE|nr:unnamed protein product [Brassicogethes aeneus]